MAAEDALLRSELGRAEQEVYAELLEEVDREAFEVRHELEAELSQ
jgi:hypothetical protein